MIIPSPAPVFKLSVDIRSSPENVSGGAWQHVRRQSMVDSMHCEEPPVAASALPCGRKHIRFNLSCGVGDGGPRPSASLAQSGYRIDGFGASINCGLYLTDQFSPIRT